MLASQKELLPMFAVFVASVALITMLAPLESEAISLRGSYAVAKNYMLDYLRDKIITRSSLVDEYSKTMDVVKARFDAAEAAGELDGKDDTEKENFYLKLTVEEMRLLKERLSKGSQAPLDLSDSKGYLHQGKSSDDHYDPDAEIKDWSPNLGASLEDDKEIEAALLTELDELERQASGEDEMGWSMTPEVKESLKAQTKTVLKDLVNNEARQIALAVLGAYMTGGTSIVSVVLPLLGGLKFKLAEFMINVVTDIVSSIMGKQITVTPSSISAAAVAAPTVAPVV